MISFVLDASAALTWCFCDEATNASHQLLDRAAREPFAVPAIWPGEVANALLMGERRGRMSSEDVASALALLGQLDAQVDTLPTLAVFSAVLNLARAHGLTVYDAFYLELAIRKRLKLASLDKKLRAAATDCSIALMPA